MRVRSLALQTSELATKRLDKSVHRRPGKSEILRFLLQRIGSRIRKNSDPGNAAGLKSHDFSYEKMSKICSASSPYMIGLQEGLRPT
jgi:hypothetical protein